MLSLFDYPALRQEGFEETSEADRAYNCIAWAADKDKKRWWWPSGAPNTYWPKQAPTKVSLKSFTLAFKSIGYVPCNNGEPEKGYEKIAVYALGNVPTHAARQLSNGKWTHKMGQNIDLTASLTATEGPKYGTVIRFFKRKSGKKP
jgi:hypothetical protein